MTALIAFLGVRGAVAAAILSTLLLAASGWGGWQWLRAERAVVAAGLAQSSEALANTGLKTCLQANASATFAEDARRRMAAANAEALVAALDRARQAVADAERQRAASDAQLREWRKTWGDRTATCAAALQTLDTACPELRRY